MSERVVFTWSGERGQEGAFQHQITTYFPQLQPGDQLPDGYAIRRDTWRNEDSGQVTMQMSLIRMK